ncbi:MATE family efflux transporter [Tannockella kyphosi]|uniref:MATE family efflux transporter n=1 Tax=Tannockella kyphosi TaxID=2899121 RepID=UPI002011C904|nr:MATE family efflux transporter [Tannockella kyphosi]
MSKKRVDLLNGPIAISLTKLSLPLMGMSFLQMAYNLIDMVWIGKLGAGAIASIGTGGLFIWLSQGIHTIAQLGGQVYVAQNLGAKKIKEAADFAHAAICLSFLVSFLLGCLYFFFAKPLVGFFELSSQDIILDSIAYIQVTGGLICFSLLSKLLTALITTTGDSKTPFMATTVGLVFNIIMDPILIFGWFGFPTLGVLGAAIATVTAQFIVFSILAYHAYKDTHLFNHVHLFSLPSGEKCLKIIKLGFPTTLQNTVFPLISIYLSKIVASFGDEAIAVQRIGSQIESISWMTADGFAIAVNSFVAQNYGAKNIKRAVKGFYQSALILGAIGIFASLLLFFGSKPIISIFLTEPEVIQMGVDYLVILSVSQLFMCYEILSTGTLNAFGKTAYPAIISTVCTGLRIPMAMILCSTALGLNGVWWAVSISTICKGSLLFIVINLFIFKLKKTTIE